ncbi:NUDIX hydrolase [uncultured Oscillibacter sp.]|uniref:NUDIX domain-containing protein n=1 Tax=uncultured Oscillibacter sp. TaxID=876091 RepID=UPI0025DCCD7F|nr:NUDIX hydrolase [uncultured Oscillibacter sp.]
MCEQMDLTERTLRREEKFRGKIVTVHVDTVELPNGGTALREVADHPGGVAVLALDGENQVLAVTQYRYPFGRTLLEIPAGKLDHPGEDPYAAGLRELKEETGAVPGKYESLGRILPSPGCYGEILHLYLAQDLRMEEQRLDEDEFLNVERIPFDEMVRRCLSGEIEDAKTVAAVLKAKILLEL